MSKNTQRLALAGLALVFSSQLVVAAEFHRVVRHPSGGSYIKFLGFGMSADGRVVVGGAPGPAPGGPQAFRWTAEGGVEWIDPYRPPSPEDGSPEAVAYAASYDGSVIVGSSYIDKRYVINYPYENIMGFRWEDGVQTDLPWLPPDDEAYPLDVNYNGSIAVGGSWETEVTWLVTSMAAARWVNGEPEDLGKLPNGPLWYDEDAYAKAVSADGSVIVGQSGEEGGVWRPFVWRDGEMEPLGTLTSPSWPISEWFRFQSCDEVMGISGDGLTAVGELWDGANTVPVRWSTTARVPVVLPLLAGHTEGVARAVSHDGSMIVGRSGGRGAVWLESLGYIPISLETLLRSVGLGDDIAGWGLSVYEVSADGKAVAGFGSSPEGEGWAWHADLRNPQPNDACAFAQWIGGGPVPSTQVKTTLGSLRDATVDGASACEFEHGPDVWYAFNAPVDGYLYLETCGTAYQPDPAYDLVMSVHEGTCPGGSANTLWCTDECAGPACAAELPCIRPQHLPITAGENYLVRIAKEAGAASAGTDFELKSQFLPNTDACDDAFIVDAPGPNDEAVLTLGLTSHATVETTPACEQERQDGPGVWYKVIGTGRIIVADTLDWTDYDTKLTVFCGGCGGLNCVTANDDLHYPEVLGSSVSWCSQWGAVYHILVHGKDTDTGNFGLKLWDGGSCMPTPGTCAPPNDSCEDAVHIAPGHPAEIVGDNTGATWDTTASCSASYDDVWYDYTAECEGAVQIDTCQPGVGTLQQTVLSVYSACGGTELDCDFDPTAPCLGRSTVTTWAAAGQDLSIRVANLSADSALDGTFPLRIQEFPDELSLASGMLPDAVQGQFYQTVLPVSGGCPPYVVEAELPAGLRFRFSAIYGTPQTSGVFTIPMTVRNKDGTDSAEGTMILRVLPTNDDCVDAIPIAEGGMHFGNPDATTDGPDEPFGCNFSDYTHVESDVWFCYTPSCDGEATVSLCDSAYDTKLAVYGTCRCGGMLGGLLACNDDSCGLQSEVSFAVQEGWEYAIRVGGFQGAQGDGQLTVTCVNKPACCLADGTCQDLWPEDCTVAGGVAQEARATCDLVTCPSAWQACCRRDGSCQDVSPDACWDQFGFPQGEGTTCTTTTCSEPRACCYEDSSCVDLPAEVCSEWSGTPQGSGTTCETTTCPKPPEACCMSDGSCEDLTFDGCVGQGGSPHGIGTACADATCPQPEACCFGDGHCEDLLSTLCSDAGGTPQGVGTGCTGASCPQPVAACCFADGSCQDLESDDCTNRGGRPHEAGTTCATESCPQAEACCFDDGHCEDLLSTLCSDAGGTPQGTGTECSGTGCPQPVDACCFADDSCEDLPSGECRVQGGEPQLYRLCAEVDCLALRGACCFADGTCQDLRHVTCLTAGGMGFFSDETCATHTCSQTVACCIANGTCEDLTAGMCMRGRGEPGPYGSSCSDDCNGDSLVDACQLLGDADSSGTVDLNDWSLLVGCLSGPGSPVSGPSCRVCILDCDDDVDLREMALFQRAFGEQ